MARSANEEKKKTARLAGDLCHWNTLPPDAVFQATHLIIFLPPCLGTFVLSNHSSHNSAFFKFSSPDTPANEGPTACAKQVANFPLPSLLSNQSDTLTKARAAAEGYLSPYTIPLLAEPETLVQPARLNWVLRFPLPPPNPLSNFFFLVSRTRHHSCAGHCSTIRSHCNFIRNATIPPGRITQQKNTKPKNNNATPTTPKPKTKHQSGNRVANFCTIQLK